MVRKKRDYSVEYTRRKARAEAAGYEGFWQQRKAQETVRIVTPDGLGEARLNSQARSQYASYLNYVKGVLHGLPDSKLGADRFEGKTFKDAAGRPHAFITDKALLRQLYDDGRLDMESFYVYAKR